MIKQSRIFSLLVALFVSVNFSICQNIDSLKLALKSSKQDTTKIKILIELSDYCNENEILGYAQAAMDLSEKLKYKKGIADASNNIGYVYNTQGRYEKANFYYNRSLKIYKDFKNEGGIAQCLNNIGFVFQSQGIINKALEYYQESNKIFEKIGDKKGYSHSLGNMAIIYQSQGEYDKALEYYKKGLIINQEINYKEGVGNFLNSIGDIYEDQNKGKEAIIYFRKALIVYTEINFKEGMALEFNNIGANHSHNNNIDSALIYFKKALILNREIQFQAGVAGALQNIGGMYFKKLQYKKAEIYCDSALKIAVKIGLPEKIMDASARMNKIFFAEGKYKEAYVMLELFKEMSDSISNKETRKASVKKQMNFEFEKKTVADSIKVLEEKRVITAELAAEKTKSYALYGGLALVLIFAGFIYNRFMVTHKQKKIIELKEQETQKQNLIISHQKELVEEKHKEITDSINYAERIQRSFIATKELLDENLKYNVTSSAYGGGVSRSIPEESSRYEQSSTRTDNDYFVLFKPKDVVSGDFYWASKLVTSSGVEKFALVTADSTGHGVPGAIMSLLNITSLEKAIETLTEPAEILNSTRKTIIERLKKDGSEEGGKDGMDCSITVYDFINKKLIVAAANNPVWIIRSVTSSADEGGVSRSGTGESFRYEQSSTRTDSYEIIEIKPDKMPVGKHDRDTVSFTQQEIQLQTGDVVYTLTDGFPDQFGGEKGKKFMSKNLRELLAANAHLPMHEQKQLLEKTFAEWVGNLEQVDDVTLIGVRV